MRRSRFLLSVAFLVLCSRSASADSTQAKGQGKGEKDLAVAADRYGDLLPRGSTARLGTLRFRKGFFLSQAEFSSDGKKIATAGGGQGVILWDPATGRQLFEFSNQRESRGFAFSPDGKLLASRGTAENGKEEELLLQDTTSGKVVRRLGKANLARLVFSPDGKILAGWGWEHQAGRQEAIQLWEVASGKRLCRIPTPNRWLTCLVFSPDGTTLVGCDPYGQAKTAVHVWDVATGKELAPVTGHEKAVHTASFSPDGKTLISAGEDETIRFWDYSSRKQLRSIPTQHGTVRVVCYSPDGRMLATGHSDGTVILWDAASARQIRLWRAHSAHLISLCFSPDGGTLLSASALETVPRLWDIANGQEIHSYPGHRGAADWLTFTPDGKDLLSVGRERTLLRWDVATGQPQKLFELSGSRYDVFVLAPDRTRLAAWSHQDGTLCLWDIGRTRDPVILGKFSRQPSDPPGNIRVQDACFSPDGRWLAASVSDKTHLWDTISGKEIWQIPSDRRETHLAFSPDGTVLASTDPPSDDSGIHFWDVATGKELRKIEDCQFPGSLAFSPDGRWLAASGGWQAPAQLYDLSTGKPVSLQGMNSGAYACAFSSDSKYLATAGMEKDPVTRLWEVASGKEIARFDGHDPALVSVAFSPDSRTLATGSANSTILLWYVPGKLANSQPDSPRAVLATRSLLSQWRVPPPFRYPEGKHGKGELKYINDLPVLTVAGTPEEIGEQIGVLAVKPVAADMDLHRVLPAVLKSHHIDKALPWLASFCNGLLQRFPSEYRRELEAMAKAAGVDRDLLVIVNVVPDLYNMTGCSTLVVEPGRSASGKPLFGRNLDTQPVMQIYKYSLVIIYRPEGKHAFASIGFPGTIGPFSALNDAGLALAIDGMYSTADGSLGFNPLGMPIFVAFRRLMEDSSSLAEAEKYLRSHRLATMLGLTVCDKTRGVVFELTTKNVIMREPIDDICACTNHFVSKGLATSTQCWRYPILEESRKLPKLGVADVAKKMHAVNQGSWTLQTMIFEPGELRLHVGFGKGPVSRLPLKELELASLFKR
jgi:WD40 repeat protein